MGSIIQGRHWEDKKREAFTRAFGKIKQKVIWKYENKTLLNKPENVMITSWLPQRDILAHPNVKAFITHGGLLGVSESITEGIPFIGIPIYSDQYMNVKNAVKDGYGILMHFDDITEEIIIKNINEIIKNPKYSKNAKELSNRFNDRPMNPEQLTNYWVEYVIRHNGAPIFKSPAHDLNLLQRNSIDLYLALVMIVWMVVYLMKRIFNVLFGSVKNNKNKQKLKTK